MNYRVQYIFCDDALPVNEPARAAPLGRPKDPEKRAALVEAAGTLFCQHGFDAVSVEAIAQAAGVSKLTVYSHFGDKEGLFTAAVEARCQQQMPHGLFTHPADLPLRDALTLIGHAFVELVFSDDAMQLMRMIAAQPAQQGDLARLYFKAGPRRTLDEMEGFLRLAAERGQIAIKQPEQAAEQFFVLLKGIHHFRCLLGLETPPQGETLARHVADSVEFFLSAHGLGRTGEP